MPGLADDLGPLALARGFASRHLTYVVAIGTFSLVGLRVLQVAQFNTTVALGLLAGMDSGRVLLGMFLSLFPVVGAIGMIGSSAALGVAFATRRVRFGAAFLFLAPLEVALLSARLTTLMYAFAMSLIVFVMTWSTRRLGVNLRAKPPEQPAWMSDERSAQYRDARATTLLIVVSFALTGVIGVLNETEPWLPTERVTLKDRVVVAYVVSDDGRWVTLPRARDRALEIVPSGTVTAREVCGSGRGWARTLVEVLTPDLKTPACPEP